jgi:hypothetical protein
VTVAVLIVYSLFSIKTAHDCVSSEVMRLVDEQTKESLLNRATMGARLVKTELDIGSDAAHDISAVADAEPLLPNGFAVGGATAGDVAAWRKHF